MQRQKWYQNEKLILQWLPLVCLFAIALIGILWPDPTPLAEGLINILRSPNVLIHDYMAVGGVRACLLYTSAHLLFNVLGVLAVIPFYTAFVDLVASTAPDLGRQIANGHTLLDVYKRQHVGLI